MYIIVRIFLALSYDHFERSKKEEEEKKHFRNQLLACEFVKLRHNKAACLQIEFA